MQIFPVTMHARSNQASFKGVFKYIQNYRLLDEKPEEHRNFLLGPDTIYSLIPPTAKCQRTLYDFHSEPLGTVYFADPEETVNDDIRMKADYVIYDEKPEYPDVHDEVSKGYFFEDTHDYSKNFGYVRDYYYRMEMAALRNIEICQREINAGRDVQKNKEKLEYFKYKVEQAKHEQWKAAECINLYNQGYDLRILKGTQENEIKNLQSQRRRECEELARNKDRLKDSEIDKEHLEYDRSTIAAKKKACEILRDTRDSVRNRFGFRWDGESSTYMDLHLRIFYGEEEAIKKKIPQLTRFIEKYETKIEEVKKEIEKYKKLIAEAPKKIEALDAEIAKKEGLLSETKSKLIPLFDMLKEFYAKQHIRVK